MSIDLDAIADWSYETPTLTKLSGGGGTVDIDVVANFDLHMILSDKHWQTTNTNVYSSNPADWTERSIRWNRATEDPPVLGVEQTIGAADYVDYTVIELEDDASFGPILDDIATILQDGHDAGFSSSHSRQLLKEVVRALQLANLL
jgi:hypothetical protein